MSPTVKLSWRSMLDNKVRFLLTTVAVVLGVGFVSGSFIVADSLKDVFSSLVKEVNKGIDVQVRSQVAFGTRGTGNPVPRETLVMVRQVPGVAAAEGAVSEEGVVIIGPDGKAKTPKAAPTIGVSWGNDPELNPLHLVDGKQPAALDEVALDVTAAEKSGYKIGQRASVLLPDGRHDFTLVGTFKFGTSNSLAGAYLVAWDTETASQILSTHGNYTTIDVRAAPGVPPTELRDRIQQQLPHGLEAIDNKQLVKDAQGQFSGIINIFGTALLVFAGVAVFVSCFIINNTFAILLGQRVRELALLRAIGAAGRQVRRMVLGEAAVVAAVSWVVGVGVGVLIALGIRALINSLGGDLPSTSIVITPRTLIVALIVAFAVTLLSALRPARRAATVPPIAAISGTWDMEPAHVGRRAVGAAVVTVGGLAILLEALYGRPGGTGLTLSLCGLGAALVFLGVAGLSHLIARPVVSTMGKPLGRVFRVPGRLARENAARNPRRTSSTASALMIGLALVSAISVLGASVKQSFSESLRSSITADLFITTNNNTGSGFPPAVVDAAKKVPGVATASGFRAAAFQVDGSTKQFAAGDPKALTQLLDIGVKQGRLENLGKDQVFVHKDPAKDLSLSIGSRVRATFPSSGTKTLEVVGIYDDASVIGANWLVDNATYDENFPNRPNVFLAAARFAPGVDRAATTAAVSAAVTAIAPQLKVQDRAAFQKNQEQQVNILIAVVNALLALAVIISMIGIANTLALSVYERIREFGLLRAVGMSRRQMRRMVRWEAALVAFFGALIGAFVGVGLGLLVAVAVPAAFIKAVAVPFGQLVGYVVVAILAGLLAALLPARRAARLNILEAIAHE
jgi:putative ABC transport system permease protein